MTLHYIIYTSSTLFQRRVSIPKKLFREDFQIFAPETVAIESSIFQTTLIIAGVHCVSYKQCWQSGDIK